MNWKAFFVLLALGGVGYISIISLAISLFPLSRLPVPLHIILVAQAAQVMVLLAISIFVGLSLGSKVGLGAYVIEERLAGRPVMNRIRSMFAISILLGVIASTVIMVLEYLFFKPLMPPQLYAVQPPVWQGFLASFYGGIDEEIMTRFGLMSLFAWALWKVKSRNGRPMAWEIWLANIAAALLFGLGHLPATAQLVPLTLMVAIRGVMLNGIGGIVFGYLYWKKGLEAAMLSHFSADVVIHGLTPLIIP